MVTPEGSRSLIDAVWQQRALPVATELATSSDDAEVRELATAVRTACEEIRASNEAEAQRIAPLGHKHKVTIASSKSDQLNRLLGVAPSWHAAQAATNELRDAGYSTWHDVDSAAEAALYRATDTATMTRLDDEPFVVEISWPPGPLMKVPAPLRPRVADVSFVPVPEKLWPLHLGVRPLRLAAERFGLVEPRARQLGPILSTPRALIGPLLDFAEVGPDDHLVDLGCGEGRVVSEAAKQKGCAVTGVESDGRLVERARRDLTASLGSDAKATIVHGDADAFDLSDATVIFLFVPAEATNSIIASLRQRGFTGRVVSHEQAPLPGSATPEKSAVLTAPGALTVAHLWTN